MILGVQAIFVDIKREDSIPRIVCNSLEHLLNALDAFIGTILSMESVLRFQMSVLLMTKKQENVLLVIQVSIWTKKVNVSQQTHYAWKLIEMENVKNVIKIMLWKTMLVTIPEIPLKSKIIMMTHCVCTGMETIAKFAYLEQRNQQKLVYAQFKTPIALNMMMINVLPVKEDGKCIRMDVWESGDDYIL